MLASLYEYIYLLLVIILTGFVMSQYDSTGHQKFVNHNATNNGLLLFVVLFFSIAIGLRPLSYQFVDMMNYYQDYEVIKGSTFFFSNDTDNLIFDNIFNWFASNSVPIEIFFLFIACIYFCCAALACKKLFPHDALLAYIIFLGAFSTFSYGTNGIKAGAAASIFLLALAYREKKIWAIFFLWLSLGFHHSMLAPIVAYIVAYYYRKPGAYVWAWITCLLLAAAHVTFFLSFFSSFTDEHGTEYLVENGIEKSVSGFRPDFILYSAVPIYIGYHLMRKRYVISDTYKFLWCTYTLTNCVFLLCTYGDFINRIAYLSWLMYPIVLLYPFVNTKWVNHPKTSTQYLKYAVYGHLAFTVFMVFVYYV